MGVYKKAVITDAGNALRAQAVAGNVTMQFTHAKASSYLYPEGTDLKKLTELQEVRQTIVPSKVQISNDTLISVRALFGNEKITSSYLIQNVGVYVSDGNKEILFAVCQAVTPDQMPAYDGVAPSSFIYDIQLAVAQATEINITIGEAGTATVKDVMDLEKRMDSLIQTMKKNSLSVTVEGDTLCFSGGWKEEQELTSVAFTNLSFGALPASADTDNWAVTEGDLKVGSELSGQTAKFVAKVEEGERAYLYRNTGTKASPVWEKWYPRTMADAVETADGRTVQECLNGSSGGAEGLSIVDGALCVTFEEV